MQIFISRWMFKAKPGKEIIAKYSRWIIFRSQVPFGWGWKKRVDVGDLGAMEQYQRRITIWYLTVIIPFIMFFVFIQFVSFL